MTRKITKEQFSTGTNIDGNRIEKALEDIQDRINVIPLGDIKTRYMPYQLCGGVTPSFAQFVGRLDGGIHKSPRDPFFGAAEKTGMDNWNPSSHTFDNTVYTEKTAIPAVIPDLKKENPVSVKGSALNTDYYTPFKYVRNWVCSNAFSTTSPLIIDEISCWFGTNHIFDKSFVTEVNGETAAPPFWGETNDYKSLGDIQFILSVDHDDISESIQLRINEFVKNDFHAWSGHMVQIPVISPILTYLPTDLGVPNLYTTPVDVPQLDIYWNSACLYFVFKDLNISLPENARWRLNILIPDYQKNRDIGTDWGARPDQFELSWSVTGKEQLKGRSNR